MTRGCSAGLRLQSPSSDSWVTSAITSFLYSRHAGASASRSKSGGPRGRPEGHAMLLGLRLLWLRPYPARPVQGLGTHCSASTLRSRLPSQSPSAVSASAPLSNSRPPLESCSEHPLRERRPRPAHRTLFLDPHRHLTRQRFVKGVCAGRRPALADAAWDLGRG